MRALSLALLLAVSIGSARAQTAVSPPGLSTTGQPDGFEVTGKAYVVDGHGSAKWGMSPADVRTAAARDFPAATFAGETVDPGDGMIILTARVPALAPGIGPATILYGFDAAAKRLAHIDIVWAIERPTPADRERMTAAGSSLVRDLLGHYWKLLSVMRGVPVGSDQLLLFAGAGEAGGAVNVMLEGVGYRLRRPDGVEVDVPAPASGIAVALRMRLASTPAPNTN